jgi:hypothetical protein
VIWLLPAAFLAAVAMVAWAVLIPGGEPNAD